MSWSLNLIGKKAAVIVEVTRQLQNSGHTAIQTAIVESIAAIPDPTPLSTSWGCDSVRVKGSGHGGQINELLVEPFCEVQPPVPVAPPISNANVAAGCEKFSEPK